MRLDGAQEISLFETNIRVVGGLMSAYDLSGDALFLQKATELVDLMVPAMGGPSSSGALPSPPDLPYSFINALLASCLPVTDRSLILPFSAHPLNIASYCFTSLRMDSVRKWRYL